jgi:DNA-binding NarL/FixJ family response regulator
MTSTPSPQREITVGIAAPEVLVRYGIRATLTNSPGIQVVAEADNAVAAVDLAKVRRPDVLVLDTALSGGDGFMAADAIRRMAPGTAVVLLSATATDEQIHRALRVGVTGFLLKDGQPRELVTAVRALAAGEAALSPAITRRVLDMVRTVDDGRIERSRHLVTSLTAREAEVLRLLAAGLSNGAIGRALYLSEVGVKTHVTRLLTKLRCLNRVQAAIVAHDAGLVGAERGHGRRAHASVDDRYLSVELHVPLL